MRAALLEAGGQPLAIYDDVVIGEPSAGQVRVRVEHCGVCHSDLSIADGVFPSLTPVVLGHEAAGVVDAVGADVKGLAPGDHVVLTPIPPCGTCYWCVRGEPGVCVNATGIQTSALPDGTTGLSRGGAPVYRGVGVGAFAEYVLTPATGAVKVADDVPLDVACVLGCAVQTGVGAVLNTARVEPGATVLVLGLGGVGLSIVQGARVAGASRIIAVDPVAARRQVALRFGATDAIDPRAADVVSRTFELTEVGADYAFDAVGRASLVQDALRATRNGGTTVAVGAPPIDEAITIAPAALFTVSEKKLLGCTLGSSNSLREIPRLLALWRAGRLDLEALVTARRPLAEINDALADLRASRGIRTVLAMGSAR
ncbi:MAG TPA: Zn-dependent alcohol dehydrogenase [Candidatus Binatia bacterium]|nr:Zn-dependent alcohol dehydrogenase [Candidatus Binatia bacterium]